jgi:hypothetical protein
MHINSPSHWNLVLRDHENIYCSHHQLPPWLHNHLLPTHSSWRPNSNTAAFLQIHLSQNAKCEGFATASVIVEDVAHSLLPVGFCEPEQIFIVRLAVLLTVSFQYALREVPTLFKTSHTRSVTSENTSPQSCQSRSIISRELQEGPFGESQARRVTLCQ